jgi:hypothetical protein
MSREEVRRWLFCYGAAAGLLAAMAAVTGWLW